MRTPDDKESKPEEPLVWTSTYLTLSPPNPTFSPSFPPTYFPFSNTTSLFHGYTPVFPLGFPRV
jgi:hypothetical protein